MQDVTNAVPHFWMARRNVLPCLTFQHNKQTVRVSDLMDCAYFDLLFRCAREPNIINLEYPLSTYKKSTLSIWIPQGLIERKGLQPPGQHLDGTLKGGIGAAIVVDRWTAAHGVGGYEVADRGGVFSDQESVNGHIAAEIELLVGRDQPVERCVLWVTVHIDITTRNKQGIGKARLCLRTARDGDIAGRDKGGHPRAAWRAWTA